MKDMFAKGRGKPGKPNVTGQRNGQSKLTDEIVRQIRASNESNAALGRKLGVHGSLISMVRSRKIWRHVA
jgi:hypothetical protein